MRVSGIPVVNLNIKPEALYETDYHLWLAYTIQALEVRDFTALDLDNLMEELSDLGRRDRKKLKSLLRHLFEHLLKLQYWQAEYRHNQAHWRAEITNFRNQIRDELADSPSLKPYLQAILAECYADAREMASLRSQLPMETFPEIAIANLEQVLDKDWWP